MNPLSSSQTSPQTQVIPLLAHSYNHAGSEFALIHSTLRLRGQPQRNIAGSIRKSSLLMTAAIG